MRGRRRRGVHGSGARARAGGGRRGGVALLAPAKLPELTRAATHRALERGALLPLETELEVRKERGVAFQLRVVSSLRRKEKSTRIAAEQPANPFLPYEPDLFVADLSDTHVCLLNKYYVLESHLLIVTRDYEDQEAPLTDGDFAALRRCLAGIDGLGFYNAGRAAGASQPHRHLQLVPPLGPGSLRAPIETALPGEGEESLAALPFSHAFTRLSPGMDLLASYRRLLAQLGLTRQERPAPYNLLVTRDWMLLVPRAEERVEGVSVNALGFAGSLLATSRERLAQIRALGPTEVLRRAAACTPR